MHDWHAQLPPYIYLTLGVIFFLTGVVSTCTGVVLATRFGRVIYRATQPKEFWEGVVTYYLIGVCFVGYFLYKVN